MLLEEANDPVKEKLMTHDIGPNTGPVASV